MIKKIRVKKTRTFDKRDMTLLSDRETKAIDGGYMVNLPENVAREMIDKGWVINIDPMKPLAKPRTVKDVMEKNPGLPGPRDNPGILTRIKNKLTGDETDGNEGTIENVPGEGTDGEVQPEPGASDGDENGAKTPDGDDPGGPTNPGLS